MNNLIKSEPWQNYANPENKYENQRFMPFAISAGITAGAAIAAGTATAASYVAVAAAVAVASSLVMTVVGAATGDKELMKIGGYVGLAGGVASIGAGLAGAGGAAATSAGTSTAAQAGQEAVKATASQAITPAMQSLTQTTGQQAAQAGAGQAAQAAITPAFQSTAQVGTQAAATGQALPTVAGLSGEAAQGAAQSAAQLPIQQGSSVGTEVGKETLKNVGDKGGSGFFDFLNDNKEAISVVGEGVKGLAKGAAGYLQSKQQNKLGQAQLDFQKEMYYGNKPGNFSIEARQPTYAEQQQYKREQAALAREQARTLTGRG